MTIYGLYGITHGWGRLLTLMSPEGTPALLGHVEPGDDIIVERREGGLPQFHAQRSGALERLVERFGVTVLGRDEWEAKKIEFGLL